jgi:hypothetical protein
MAQGIQDPREKRIWELEAQIEELKTKLAETEKRRVVLERSLLEDGLRLSQENEALRKAIAALKRARGPAK